MQTTHIILSLIQFSTQVLAQFPQSQAKLSISLKMSLSSLQITQDVLVEYPALRVHDLPCSNTRATSRLLSDFSKTSK